MCNIRVPYTVLLWLLSYRTRHEIINMLVRKELIFLLIRPVLVKVDWFSEEQAGRQQCCILPPATSLHWQQLVKGPIFFTTTVPSL
jgi:hypothetical protein